MKLGPRYIGPFPIKRKINPVAFQFSLLDSYKIHLVFHVSLLKPAFLDPFPGRVEPPPLPVNVEEEMEYEVESVLDFRT